MKRIISFALICVLVLSSLLLTACDLDSSDDLIDSGATDTETVTDTETETEVPAEPVPVDSLGGKNPKQLFLQFYDEYTQASSYDISMIARTAKGSIAITSKANDTAAYIYMEYNGNKTKIWVVDGVPYTEKNGCTHEATQSDIQNIFESIDSVFGEGFMEQMMASFPDKDDLPQTYLNKYEVAQLYFDGELYYCTVDVSDAEAQAMGEKMAYKETIYFDSNGRVKKMVDESEDMYASLDIASYGESVVIEISESRSSDCTHPDCAQ